MTLGLFIRQARDRAHLTRKILGAKCKVSREWIYMIETEQHVPSALLCKSMAKHLGLNLDALLLKAGHVPDDVMLLLQSDPSICNMIRQRAPGPPPDGRHA